MQHGNYGGFPSFLKSNIVLTVLFCSILLFCFLECSVLIGFILSHFVCFIMSDGVSSNFKDNKRHYGDHCRCPVVLIEVLQCIHSFVQVVLFCLVLFTFIICDGIIAILKKMRLYSSHYFLSSCYEVP